MADKLTPAADHNSAPSKGTFLAHLRKIAPAKTAVEEANGVYRALLKSAKKDGVNQKQLIAAMNARKLDQDEVAKDARDFARYMAWMGLPIGAQTSLFGEENEAADDHTTDLEDAEQRAFDASEAGYEAGRKGQKREDNPHEPGSETHDAWDRAWINGQARIAAEMGPDAERVAAPKRGRGVPRRRATGEPVN